MGVDPKVVDRDDGSVDWDWRKPVVVELHLFVCGCGDWGVW